MIKVFLLLIPFYLYSLVSPYESLSNDEKINILINQFLNEELKENIPNPPIKGKLQDSSPIVPVKYEQHFSFIQRFKATTESRAQEQQKIDDKYLGDVGFYNGKLKTLKKFYSKDENIDPIIQNAINKTYKVLYGKPKITKLQYDKTKDELTAIFFVSDIYGFNKFEDKNITFDIPTDYKSKFKEIYREAFITLAIKYKNNILTLDHIVASLYGTNYKGYFNEKKKEKIKLEIKINDDIFQLIKIKDK